MIIEGRDLRVPALTFLTMQIRDRKDIIDYVKQYEQCYWVEDNIIFSPKIFIINSAIQWCYNQIQTDKMQANEMDFYLLSIQAFINGQANIAWDKDGNLVIS